ncbi:MAG: CCA tRNA nucleotidyltransferase [Rhodoblastus sp.]|nr:MAG: CCA tRNA nucleotidyltransferase [Rhodoblastus sp.]
MDGARALLADPPLAALLSALDRDGEEARVVGGAVRDALLGAPVSDVDVCTTATPDEVERRVKALRWKAAPTGVEHGTWTVVIEGRAFEVTTLREDVETFGRKAIVRFGRDFRADALRRDFTINALSLDRGGRVHDYAGGLDDLAARRVRFIGDPAQRIREDYLRILRLLRFHARFARGPIDREAMAAAIAAREGLDSLSRERVRAEIVKLLVAPEAAATLAQAEGAGLLLRLSARRRGSGGSRRLAAREGDPPDATLRLGALAVETAEDAARLRERLRLSNEEHDRLDQAARFAARLRGRDAPDGDGLKEALYRVGRRAAQDGLTLAWLDAAPERRPGFAAALAALPDVVAPQAPFCGDDLMARGVAAGRRLGATLKAAQAAWIRAGFPSDPGVLAQLLDRAAEQA